MRVDTERQFWDTLAQEIDVDTKYISDIDIKLCKKDLPNMSGEVLEIGCGVGRLLKPEWWGIDISEKMLDIAISRGKCLVILSDGRTIPFEDNRFDYIYCYLVFQHIPYKAVKSYINEAYRTLKKSGTFTFQWIEGIDKAPYSKHYSQLEINDMTKEFSKVSTVKSRAYDGWLITRCIK